MRISDWSSDVCSSDLEARYDAEGLRLALARPGSLRIAAFGATTPLQLQAPLAFAVDRLELEAAPEDGGYRYRLGAREDGARFAIAAAGADPHAVTAGALAVPLDGRFDSQAGHAADLTPRLGGLARKSVLSGTCVSVRVVLGGSP